MGTPTPTSPLASFLGGMPAAEFLRDHYFRLPLARPGGALACRSLAAPGLLERLLAPEGVDAFLALDGRMWEGGRAPDADAARRLAGEGWTAVVRNAQRHDAGLAALADGFRRDLGAPVNVHVYATPAGRTGFGWHYDAEDVFILQLEGVKEYRLRKNTVSPWPVLERMGPDLRFEREISPEFAVRLGPGDGLYIPPGWWHRADGVEDAPLTVAVGLLSPTGLTALDLLRRDLLANPAWRQRLPVAGLASGKPPENLESEYEALFRELGKDLARALSDGALARRFLEDVTRQRS